MWIHEIWVKGERPCAERSMLLLLLWPSDKGDFRNIESLLRHPTAKSRRFYLYTSLQTFQEMFRAQLLVVWRVSIFAVREKAPDPWPVKPTPPRTRGRSVRLPTSSTVGQLRAQTRHECRVSVRHRVRVCFALARWRAATRLKGFTVYPPILFSQLGYVFEPNAEPGPTTTDLLPIGGSGQGRT